MNFGGTVRISRCGVLSLVATCFIIIVYYLATNHHVEGSLAHTIKNQLRFAKRPDTIQLRSLLAVAIRAAERGGSEVAQVRKDADLEVQSKGKTREGVNDPLTEGDMRSHFQMYHLIKKMFPGVMVISEEKNRPKDAHPDILPVSMENRELEMVALDGLDEAVPIEDITVWIDPLDATKEYTENKLAYVTTMVCVAVRGTPVFGVIHRPFRLSKDPSGASATYWGWVDHGVSGTLAKGSLHMGEGDVSPVEPAPPHTLSDPLKVLVSMSHAGATEAFSKKAFGDVQMVPAAGAGFKTLATLFGMGDVYLHTTLIKKWDTCAADAVLRAMNGKMTTLRGAEITYQGTETAKNEKIEDGIIATWSQYHAQLLNSVKRAQDQ